MTPLIREMSALVPEPETAHWFDLGVVPNHVPADRLNWEAMRHMPYPRTVSVFRTERTDTRYAVWTLASSEHKSITIAYLAYDSPGGRPMFSRPMAIVETEGQLAYRVDGKEPMEKESVQRVIRVLATIQSRIHGIESCYRPTPAKGASINAKRIRQGKKPLFDWHTVQINNQPKAEPLPHQGGHHASPRQHDRRGHFRSLKSGKRVWVRDCKVGNAANGVVFKDYEVRQ